MQFKLVILTVLLAGCVTTSRVATIGPNKYMVTASNDACGNCSNPPQIRAAEQAQSYCSGMGKKSTVQNGQDQTFDIGFGHKYTITFTCEYAK